MFNVDDFIEDFREQSEQESEMETTRARDKWLRGSISLFAILVAGYTTVHGISATLHYRAAGVMGMATGIVGIIVLEGLFLALSHGLINGTFKGGRLHVGLMALATAVSLVFMLLNTIIDAQLNAQITLSENMLFYFRYVLPISSVIAVCIALAGLYFAPDAERARQRGEAINAYKAQQFASYISARKAELMVQRAIANAQLGARITAAKTVAQHYQGDEVRQRIEGAAVASIPALLRQIGVSEGLPSQVVQEDDTAVTAAPPPPTLPVGTPLYPSFPHEMEAAEAAHLEQLADTAVPAANGRGPRPTNPPGMGGLL
jgi:hypothetical protein